MTFHDSRYSLNEENFDLTVTGVRAEDAGDYFCLVNNKLEGQDVVKLSVVAPPEVTILSPVSHSTSGAAASPLIIIRYHHYYHHHHYYHYHCSLPLGPWSRGLTPGL